MKAMFASFLIAGVANAIAAAPADAPAGTMGMCKDGTYSSSPEKKGACRGHKGVKDWYAEDTPAKGMPAKSERAPSTATAATPATPMEKPTTPAIAGRTSGAPMAPAPGGGAGQVWANTSTKVYHCEGAKYYGTTKHGEYMSEADAKTKGYHADHGKACV